MSIEQVSKQIHERVTVGGPTLEVIDKDIPDDARVLLDALDGRRGYAQRCIAEEVVAFGSLMVRKNQDYGDTIHHVPELAPDCDPETAILVRMSDKLGRLRTLMGGSNPQVFDETIDDTMRDLGAYCLLYLVGKRRRREEGSDG